MALATVSNNGVASLWTLRAALVATTSYVASNYMPCRNRTALAVLVTCAGVDYTSLTIQYEFSYDGTTFFAMPGRDASTAGVFPAGPFTDTFTLASFQSATATKIGIPVSVLFGAVFFRVSILRTGGTAVGTVLLTAVEGPAA